MVIIRQNGVICPLPYYEYEHIMKHSWTFSVQIKQDFKRNVPRSRYYSGFAATEILASFRMAILPNISGWVISPMLERFYSTIG